MNDFCCSLNTGSHDKPESSHNLPQLDPGVIAGGKAQFMVLHLLDQSALYFAIFVFPIKIYFWLEMNTIVLILIHKKGSCVNFNFMHSFNCIIT